MTDMERLQRMLDASDARHAERRKRRKPTASEAFARMGMNGFLSPHFPNVQKEKELPIVHEEDEEFDLSELSDWD